MWRDPFMISTVLGMQLEKYCRSVDVDFASMCLDQGVDFRIFSSLTGQLSCLAFAQLLEKLALRAGDPLFGFRAALYVDLGALGPLTYAIRTSKNMRSGWASAKKYRTLGFNHSKLDLFESENASRFVWELSPYARGMPQLTDFAMVISVRTFDVFGDPASEIMRVNTTRLLPPDTSLHEQLFGPVIWFGQQEDSIVVSTHTVDRMNPHADQMMTTYMQLQCEVIANLFKFTLPFEVEVKKTILTLLETKDLSLEAIALKLALSSRSLQRKLGSYGKTFSQLIDETRKEYAEHLLCASNLSIETIGEMVGFKSPSVLSRASVAWFGMSPSEYRKQSIDYYKYQTMQPKFTFARFFR